MGKFYIARKIWQCFFVKSFSECPQLGFKNLYIHTRLTFCHVMLQMEFLYCLVQVMQLMNLIKLCVVQDTYSIALSNSKIHSGICNRSI